MSASEPVPMGRKRALPACPNPLFVKWLTELRDEAREKGLKLQYTYQKAISSLNKYPLPLRDAREAKILQNFGDGICKILDSKLHQHYREYGQDTAVRVEAPPPVGSDDKRPVSSRENTVQDQKRGRGVAKKRKREYAPQKGSGGYAVLLALYRHSQAAGSKGFMFKMELQDQAQHLCQKSFTVPELGRRCTAWSAVAALVKRNLLQKTHCPARYSLTEEGTSLARRLDAPELASKAPLDQDDDEDDAIDLAASEDDEEEDGVQPRCEAASGGRLLAGTFDIVLCVDVIETCGGGRPCKRELVRELQRSRVNFDVRKLNVGDFLWVAREKVTPSSGALSALVLPSRRPPARLSLDTYAEDSAGRARELVLDYIVERKRMDDLCGSIIDGRFREQKFRLKRCGLRRPIYLVEGGGKEAAHLSIPEMTLRQAVVNTQVADDFFVKRVRDVRESAAYLAAMTAQLAKLYQKRTLACRSRELDGDPDRRDVVTPFCSLVSFSEFNYGAVKNKSQTVREAFARQLMQVSGLSADKAAAVLERYSTPHSLLAAYAKCKSDDGKEKLLSGVPYGRLSRNLGPALSRTLSQLYCTNGALS
ncbi:crossover junction endonuclease MUS81 isoform X2 [Phyllopteryx taeniolatus]|uniref:crossover junction endonuclease MUS81 isoform X2 n=1 Tax=Phyllopteryx taeniolatus TaxID=161469 RepID=UPI002AD43352|nr:crossover junction endonuclease MUS81 isoform X2 [Phyllopteryx taeniolatus]